MYANIRGKFNEDTTLLQFQNILQFELNSITYNIIILWEYFLVIVVS